MILNKKYMRMYKTIPFASVAIGARAAEFFAGFDEGFDDEDDEFGGFGGDFDNLDDDLFGDG